MERVAGIADTTHDQTDPTRDVELGTRSFDNQSRVSLPLSHRRSFSTLRSRAHSRAASSRSLPRGPNTAPSPAPGAVGVAYGGEDVDPSTYDDDGGEPYYDDDDEEPDENEIPWGPSHPCYPHLNPHVPITSPLYASTRIIRLKRDWMVAGDLAPTFSALYPEILDPHLPEPQFRALLAHVNAALVRAFDPWRPRAWLDACAGMLTGWLWDDAGMPAAKKELVALAAWVERWNHDVGRPAGVEVVPLRRTAFLCLDIQIPDPRLGVDPPDDDDAAAEAEAEAAAPPQPQQQQQPARPDGPGSVGVPRSGWSWRAARRRSSSFGRSSRPASMMSGRTSAWSFRAASSKAREGGGGDGGGDEARGETPVPRIPDKFLEGGR